jgi:hypothetical protein
VIGARRSRLYTREAQRAVKFVCLSAGRRCCTDEEEWNTTQKNSKWKGRKSLKRMTPDSSTAHQLYVFAVERDSPMLMAGNPGRSTPLGPQPKCFGQHKRDGLYIGHAPSLIRSAALMLLINATQGCRLKSFSSSSQRPPSFQTFDFPSA